MDASTAILDRLYDITRELITEMRRVMGCTLRPNRSNAAWGKGFAPRWSLLSLIVALGCAGDAVGPGLKSSAQLYWAIPLNVHAVNLALSAPYDTVQIKATPVNALGQALPDSEAARVRYTASDSTVTVSATGLVTAHYVTTKTQVVASLTINGTTLADTTIIRVTPVPLDAPIATLSIQPQPNDLDSAKIALNAAGVVIPVYATVATGDPATDTVCNAASCQILVHFALSDSTMARIDAQGLISPKRIGHVTVYVSTLAYGRVKQDSAQFTIGYPLASYISPRAGGDPREIVPILLIDQVTIGVGGSVTLDNGDIVEGVEIALPNDTSAISIFAIGPDRRKHMTDTLPTLVDGDTADVLRAQFFRAGTYHVRFTTLQSHQSANATIIVSSGP